MKFKDVKKYIKEEKKQDVKIEIICNEITAYESILPLINYIKLLGAPGHSFDIVVDPDATKEQGKENFGFDGDGSHHIKSIKINGKKYKKDDE